MVRKMGFFLAFQATVLLGHSLLSSHLLKSICIFLPSIVVERWSRDIERAFPKKIPIFMTFKATKGNVLVVDGLDPFLVLPRKFNTL